MSKTYTENQAKAVLGCFTLVGVVFAWMFLCAFTSFGGAFVVWIGESPISLSLAIPLLAVVWFSYRGMVGLTHALLEAIINA